MPSADLPGFAWTSEESLARLLDSALDATAEARGQAIFEIPGDLDDATRKAVWNASIGLGFLPGDAKKSARGGTFVYRAAEARTTSAVLYVPDTDDAHGEYVTRDDLFAAALGYSVSEDKTLHVMHDQRTDGGEVVAVVDWPYEEVAQGRTLKAGTVYAVTRWSEDAWAAVKAGKLNGLSLGGTAIQSPSRA